ncbi:serine hydrolase domain-containing protein [Chryseolinea sp. T2]|uniref:serine hydrolase domain-containing protein n=1 Tax=Chryseolinea sp. T2 TaxID=3129255 RepID=UPI003076B638
MRFFCRGYGWSNTTTRAHNAPDTRFPILSITKTFTATVILKLQEDGKLSVQDRLTKYFPDYPNGRKIRIHHLLTHTSGIYNYTEPVGVEDSALVNHPISRQKILDVFENAPVGFEPGKGYSYNNSGYFLLGLIIEKVTGKPYEMVVRELIFSRLGMTNSGFDFLKLPDSLKAKGYEFMDSEKAIPYKHYDSTFAYSAGSIYSTVADMYKWARAVANQQILTSDSWKVAVTPEGPPKIGGYGYGWMTGEFSGHRYVRHSGGYPGYMSEFVYYPETKLIIILLNNFGTYDENIWATAMGITSIAFNEPYDNWKSRKEVKVDLRILQRYVGTYEYVDKRVSKHKIVVRLENDDIVMDVPGLSLKLYPESENVFYFKSFNTECRFGIDAKGDVRLNTHEHGRDFELKRLQ